MFKCSNGKGFVLCSSIVKTWLLLGKSEWRWSDDPNKTYWYDSVELIRTNENEELSDLLKVVKNKLTDLLGSLVISPDNT